jgi:hypothetical protein
MERRGKGRQDFEELGVCTREKLTHVKDCKTGSHYLLVTFFEVCSQDPLQFIRTQGRGY